MDFVQVLVETPLEPKALTMAGHAALRQGDYLVSECACMHAGLREVASGLTPVG